MPYFRIEIRLKSGKIYKVVREVSKSLDEYYLDMVIKARKEFQNDLAFFDLVQLSRHSGETLHFRMVKPIQEDVYNGISAQRGGIKSNQKGRH